MDRLRVCCVTWNVQGRSPESVQGCLRKLLKVDALVEEADEEDRRCSWRKSRHSSRVDAPSDGDVREDAGCTRNRNTSGAKHATGNLPDVYAIGLQEIPIGPQYLLMDTLFDDVWSDALGSILCPFDFIRVKRMRMLTTLLLVFMRKEHLLQCRDILGASTRSGIAGVLGNKGSVTVRMTLRGTSLCVVNSHLPAHDYLLAERIRAYNEAIMTQSIPVEETSKILYHDYVFWIGDLNFRLDDGVNPPKGKLPPNSLGRSGPSYDEVVEKVSSGSAKELVKNNDQLWRCMQTGQAFSELKEPVPTFPPTYKFVAGTNRYDPSKVPAWCDRILFKVNQSNYQDVQLDLRQHSYNSYPGLALSDHLPVYSLFSFSVFPERPIVVVFPEEMDNWVVGDDATVKFHVAKTYQVNPFDWLGLFRKHFTSLDAYQSYMWVASARTLQSDMESRIALELTYPTTLLVPGDYVLLYFDHKSASVLGISRSFRVMAQPRQDAF